MTNASAIHVWMEVLVWTAKENSAASVLGHIKEGRVKVSSLTNVETRVRKSWEHGFELTTAPFVVLEVENLTRFHKILWVISTALIRWYSFVISVRMYQIWTIVIFSSTHWQQFPNYAVRHSKKRLRLKVLLWRNSHLSNLSHFKT